MCTHPRLLKWLSRFASSHLSLVETASTAEASPPSTAAKSPDDWEAVSYICGHTLPVLRGTGPIAPLTTGEIDFFRRNHRGTENHVNRDFLSAQTDLPSPLAEFYGLYRHRARLDAEAALCLAQSTGSTRVPRIMADLLAIGAFASGHENLSYLGRVYAIPAAFDSSASIDRANREALHRLALPVDDPDHLLRLSPDEIGVLAATLEEEAALVSDPFLEKAYGLSIARQDVQRLPESQHFVHAVLTRDVPMNCAWGQRLVVAYARLFPALVADLPEAQPLLKQERIHDK